MLLSPLLIVFMVWQAYAKIIESPVDARANTSLQWAIILLVFIPICIGLFIFGKYAFKGEYAHLPESSAEVED